MRLFQLPGLTGLWGQIAFYTGALITLIGGIFVGLNIFYTGATISQLFGGDVRVDATGVFWPEVQVVTGGGLGLGFGLLMGVLFFLVEFAFWVFDDHKLGRQAKIVRWAVRICETFDVGASIFLLSGGIYILSMIQADPVAWIARFIGAVGVSFIALAFGAEIWLAFGLEMMRANYGAVRRGGQNLAGAVGNFFDGLENLKESPEEEALRLASRRRGPQSQLDAMLGVGGGGEMRTPKPNFPPQQQNNGGGGGGGFRKGQGRRALHDQYGPNVFPPNNGGGSNGP